MKDEYMFGSLILQDLYYLQSKNRDLREVNIFQFLDL